MVPTGQGDKTGVRDAGGQLAPCFEWNYAVVARVHNKGRRLHFGQKFNDIDIAGYIKISVAHSGEVVFSCSSLK